MIAFGLTAMATNLLLCMFRGPVVEDIYWMAFGCWAVVAICGAIVRR